MLGEVGGSLGLTLAEYETFHKQLMETIQIHDEQAKRIDARVIACEGGIMRILETQTTQAAILTAQGVALKTQAECHERLLESQEKTVKNLESASKNLEVATAAIASNSQWQEFAQTSLIKSQEDREREVKLASDYRRKENWRLIGIIAAFVTVLLGLKALGIDV